MKIHLIRSPEYSIEDLTEVYELLNSFYGPMEFVIRDHIFVKKEFPFLKDNLYTEYKFKIKSDKKKELLKKEMGSVLSFEELFSLCQSYRKKYKINKNDFVVLVTKRFNSLNWFSHCSTDKNIFIHAAEWEKLYIKAHNKYPVAYQVIENIIQNLMELDSSKENREYFHINPRGCINDFCIDKRQVILKIRTADICEVCFERIIAVKIDWNILMQIFQIIEGLRLQFLFKKNVIRNIGPFTLKIDINYKFLIPQLGNIEIKLTPLYKAIYILFIKNPEGIKMNELIQFNGQLKKLYKEMEPPMRKKEDIDINKKDIINNIDNLTNPKSGMFSINKTKINRIFKDQLGDYLSEHYQISGKKGQPFKINLSPELIDIHL